MPNRSFSTSLLAMAWAGLSVCAAFGGQPRVSVVVGDNAPQLERFAAAELCGYLHKLYGIKAEPGPTASPDAQAVFLVGTPVSNPAIRQAAGGNFPNLSAQGIVLKRTRLGKKLALIVGGGSPQATMW